MLYLTGAGSKSILLLTEEGGESILSLTGAVGESSTLAARSTLTEQKAQFWKSQQSANLARFFAHTNLLSFKPFSAVVTSQDHSFDTGVADGNPQLMERKSAN